MANTDIATASKPTLLKRINSLIRTKKTDDNRRDEQSGRMLHSVGIGTASVAAGLTGYIRGRIRDKKTGTEFKVGPAPLPIALGVVGTVTSLFWNPYNQVSYASAGILASFASEFGKVAGEKGFRKKNPDVEIVGAEDELDDLDDE